MHSIVYSTWGLLHLIAAMGSLLFGTTVLVMPKDSRYHKKTGYAYLSGMAIMVVTAFGIYRQYGGFGIFHAAAILTSITILAGMVPVWRRKPRYQWLQFHYSFMYLSVLELYIALVAEFLVRIPGATFVEVAVGSSACVLVPGALLFNRYTRGWKRAAVRIEEADVPHYA